MECCGGGVHTVIEEFLWGNIASQNGDAFYTATDSSIDVSPMGKGNPH